jgi:hypothetical protein
MSVVSPAVDLKPGLWPLTRLRRLRLLKVGKTVRRMVRYNMYRSEACRMPGDSYEEKEGGEPEKFIWMVPAGHTEAMRAARRKGAEGWERVMQYEQFVDAQLQSQDGNNNANINNKNNNEHAVSTSAKQWSQENIDTLLRKALKDFGRITDVKNVIEEWMRQRGMSASPRSAGWLFFRRIHLVFILRESIRALLIGSEIQTWEVYENKKGRFVRGPIDITAFARLTKWGRKGTYG